MSGETEQNVSGWTVDTLRAHFGKQHEDLKSMLQERYETQTKAVDAAFIAQQTAMQTALASAERAVQAALVSAEKAVAKAENAAEKRFEATNEFRAQLSDQAATFVSRVEADTRINALDEKSETKLDAHDKRITRNENVVANIQGRMIAYAGVGALIGGVVVTIVSQSLN